MAELERYLAPKAIQYLEEGAIPNAARSFGSSLMLPVSAGQDALQTLAATLLGGKLENPGARTSQTIEDMITSGGKAFGPAAAAFGEARKQALSALGATPMSQDTSSGTTPNAGGALKTFDDEFPAPPAKPRGALPQPAQRPVARRGGAPRASSPAGGALSSPPLSLPEEQADFPVQQAAAPAAAQPAATPAAAPARPGLAERYLELTKGIPTQANGDLTPAQRQQMAMNFFLGLMSGASRPGAYMLGAAGDAGLATSREAQALQDKNLDRNTRANAAARDEAFKIMGLEDRDRDNQTNERRWQVTEKHYQAQDARDQRRLDLEMKKLEREGNKPIGHQVLANGNIAFLMPDGSVRDTGAKGREPNANEIAFDLLTRRGGLNTQDAIDRILPAKPKYATEDFLDTTNLDAMGQPTKLRRLVDVNTGEFVRQPGQQGAPAVAKPTSQAEFDKLPKGARFINPADGKEYTKK